MSAPHRWARRAMLSMLAGGGLSAAGFGGPLAGGALAAEGQPGTTTSEDQTPAVTETTPQAPAPTPAGGSDSGASATSGSDAGETSTTSATGSSTSSTAPATPPPSSTSPAPTAAAPAAGEAATPTVVVQRSQQTTPGRRHGASVTGSGKGEAGTGSGAGREEGSNGNGEGAGKGGPTTVPAGTPNGVAPAPQTAGEEAGALATLLTGSSVSAQALDFYRIPLFLLPVYQAAAFQYDVPWQVLAGINEIET
ncbi:MAG: hypothetical protein ABSH36_05380, partial [Solirubrobacteraceae bacterium]